MSYVKIFDSIVASTIWSAPSDHRVVWVTMLAIADRDGYVKASVPGLAHLCRVSREACESALASFLAPDPDSRTKTHDGRRIAVAEGGWLLLNYEFYRDMASAEEKREKDRLRQERKRLRDASRLVTDVTVGHAPSPKVASHLSSSDLTSEEKEKAPRKRGAFLVEVEKPADVMAELWDAWLAVRKRKNAPLSKVAWEGVLRETAKAGWHINEVVRKMAERGWQAVEADWLLKEGMATAGKVTANGRPVVEASKMHTPNMPLGSEFCECPGCAAAKLSKSIADAKNVSTHIRAPHSA